jgi:hypothetical protein
MAKFISLVMHRGLVDTEFLQRPEPDPAVFGLPTEDDGGRDDQLLGVNLKTLPTYVPDGAVIAAAPTQVVIAVGEESGEELAARGGRAIAERLGVDPAIFPSGHGGFLGGEYGQMGKPEAFAARLRQVLGDPGA